jgi:hypothetical protein
MPALVGGIDPHPHDRSRRGVSEPLVRRNPAGGWRGSLGVTAPPPELAGRCWASVRGLQVGNGRGRLMQICRSQDQPYPAVEFSGVEFSLGKMLAEQGKETFAVGLTNPGPQVIGHT